MVCRPASANHRLKLTGAAILVSRGIKVLQAAPAAYPYRYAAEGRAIYYPGAFDAYGLQVLRSLIAELIEVAEPEARRFACNAVVVGRHVVTNTGCPGLHAELRRRGFTPHETPLDEFIKAGGSAKCLTLRLDGEDAASWRTA